MKSKSRSQRAKRCGAGAVEHSAPLPHHAVTLSAIQSRKYLLYLLPFRGKGENGPPAGDVGERRARRRLRAVVLAAILTLALKVPLNRGEDHATMCAPHLPPPLVRH